MEAAGRVAKVEQPRFDSAALLEVLKNPLRRLFGKPALTRAADDYRNSDHAFVLKYAMIPVRASSMAGAAGEPPSTVRCAMIAPTMTMASRMAA